MKLGRNELCHCGSMKKYKKCHLNIDNDPLLASSGIPIDSELDKSFRKSRIKQCMYPKKEKCTNIIPAHSIQNNRFLNKISENGDVVMPRLTFTKTAYKAKFDTLGRKKATTFYGFCKYHDKVFFQPIEDSPYINSETDEKKFLFAYRAFAYEYHTKQEAINSHNHNNRNINKDLYDAYEKSNALAMKDLEDMLLILNEAILENNFNVLEHIEFKLKGTSPLAVSGLCNLEYDLLGNIVNNVFSTQDKLVPMILNLFSEEDHTIILISWLKKDSIIYSKYKNQLLNLEQSKLLTMLNNMLPLYFENATYDPKFIRGWSNSEEKEFLSLFSLSADLLDRYKKMQDIKHKKNLLANRSYDLFSNLKIV